MELYNFTSQCLGHDALVGVVTSETLSSTLNLRQTIAERGLLPGSSRQTRGRCLDAFLNVKSEDEDHLSAFIFSTSKKLLQERNDDDGRQNCMRNGEDTCFHNYEKRNFFSLFLRRCIPHHNFCSLFAMTRFEKRSDAEPNNDGWQLWNVFFEHEFSPFLFSLSPINTPDKGLKRFAVRFSEKPAQHVAAASKNEAENEFRRVSVIEAFASLEFFISNVSLTK